MSSRIFAFAAGTLFLQITLQLAIGHGYRAWGKKVPKESLLLIALFAGLPVVAFAFHQNMPLALLSVSLGLAYLLGFNPASGIRSPSFRVLGLMIERKSAVSEAEILAELEKDQILQRKMDDLVADGWIRVVDGRVVLSRFARAMVSFFAIYRRILNLSEGVG